MHFDLGDLLKVRIARVDLDRRELDFEVLERISPSQSSAGQPSSRKHA